MNKKIIAGAIGLLVLLLAGFYFYKARQDVNIGNQPTKIGAVLPLSGNGSQYGQYFKQGSELALIDAIDDGSIKSDQVRLIIEDGKGDATTSLTAFKKLEESDKISAILVDLSNVILAIKPETNKAQIVSINSSSFSSEIEDANDFMFSVLPNADIYGKFIGEYSFKNLGMKSAGILYRNDPMGISLDKSFRNSFNNLGGNVVFGESHKPGETDFRTTIEKLKSTNVDMIFVASYGPEVANFARQAKELNYQVQIVTFQPFFIQEALNIAQDSANGIICIASAFDPNSSDSKILSLKSKLKSKYNSEDLNYYLAAHYDGTRILLEAIAAGNTSGDNIRNYLINKKTFNGLTGQITFNENGLATIPLQAFRVENMKFVQIK